MSDAHTHRGKPTSTEKHTHTPAHTQSHVHVFSYIHTHTHALAQRAVKGFVNYGKTYFRGGRLNQIGQKDIAKS